MLPLTAAEIADCFVNCTRSEARSISLPRGLADIDWETRDFLGWSDPGAPQRAFIVAERGHTPLGVELRVSTSTAARWGSGLCDVCRSAHPADAVRLFVARRAGPAGRDGNTVGTYLCADLACSLYVRRLLPLLLPPAEVGPEQVRVERLVRRLDRFLDRVLAGSVLNPTE